MRHGDMIAEEFVEHEKARLDEYLVHVKENEQASIERGRLVQFGFRTEGNRVVGSASAWRGSMGGWELGRNL